MKRTAKVINKVIGDTQHAFFNGRQILNATFIANEVVDELTYKKRE